MSVEATLALRNVADDELLRRLSDLVCRSVTEKLERLEARRFGRTKAQRQSLVEATPPTSG
jgi:hypothetical protein